MPLRRVTPPAHSPIALSRVKGHLNILDDLEDQELAGYRDAAVRHIDGASWLGRALATQTWALDLDSFPADGAAIPIPLWPVQSVESVTYIDQAGATQTLTADIDFLAHVGDDALIEPAPGGAWPQTQARRRAVTITFVAGYGDADATEGCAALPEDITAALLLMTGDLYANRESGGKGTVAFEARMQTTIENLLFHLRVWPA